MSTATPTHTNLFNLADKMLRPFEEFEKAYKAEAINVNAQDSFGFTLLHYAVARSNLEAITFLREQGAQANIVNDRGQTALNLAQQDNKTNIAQILTGGSKLQVVEAALEGTVPFQHQGKQEQIQQQHGQLSR